MDTSWISFLDAVAFWLCILFIFCVIYAYYLACVILYHWVKYGAKKYADKAIENIEMEIELEKILYGRVLLQSELEKIRELEKKLKVNR